VDFEGVGLLGSEEVGEGGGGGGERPGRLIGSETLGGLLPFLPLSPVSPPPEAGGVGLEGGEAGGSLLPPVAGGDEDPAPLSPEAGGAEGPDPPPPVPLPPGPPPLLPAGVPWDATIMAIERQRKMRATPMSFIVYQRG